MFRKLIVFLIVLILITMAFWLGKSTRIEYRILPRGEFILEPLPTPTHAAEKRSNTSELVPKNGNSESPEQVSTGREFLESNASWYDQGLLAPSYRNLRGDGFGAASGVVEHGNRYLVCDWGGTRCVDITVVDFCSGCADGAFVQDRRFDLQMEAFAELADLGQGVARIKYYQL